MLAEHAGPAVCLVAMGTTWEGGTFAVGSKLRSLPHTSILRKLTATMTGRADWPGSVLGEPALLWREGNLGACIYF